MNPRLVSATVSREDLLVFVRSFAPDLRIRKVQLEDGRRACGAWFTFRGTEHAVEAIEGPDVQDPDDAIVRRCAWLLQRHLGIRTTQQVVRTRKLEEAIVSASLRGDTALAARLSDELVMANEGRAVRQPVRTRIGL